MITPAPFIMEKVKLKTPKRIVNILREKRDYSSHDPSMCCFVVDWLLPSNRLSPCTLPQRDAMDQHSYADLKSGQMAPITKACSF